MNQPVPLGADHDAAALSRHGGQPEQTVNNHETHYRLSLVDGTSQYDPERFSEPHLKSGVYDLLTETDPEATHRSWLDSDVVSAFNESVYYPYTSLKYHTLLVAALLDNYRSGYEFSDLLLVVDGTDEIVPHRTVYSDEEFAFRIDASANTEDRPSAPLCDNPWQSWGLTWSRLTAHPLDTSHDKYDMVLDANLRRIGAWSTALQYVEDYGKWTNESVNGIK